MKKEQPEQAASPRKVVIIGAGAAGLCAAYTLQKNAQPGEVEIQILEASHEMGGRLRKLDGFADYPIDVGGEWIHHGTPNKILSKILDHDPAVDIGREIETIKYTVNPCYSWDGEEFSKYRWNWKGDHFFVNYTWNDFIKDYLGRPVEELIEYNCQIRSIDYSATKNNNNQNSDEGKIVLTSRHGNTYEADHVIVTTSVEILRRGDIQFLPELPRGKQQALNRMVMHPGVKIFIEFSEQFYHDGFTVEQDDKVRGHGERYFYSESWGQKQSRRHVLAIFAYGAHAQPYLRVSRRNNDEAIRSMVLEELDEMYHGNASRTYLKHFVQIWSSSDESFVGGAYTEYRDYTIGEMITPVDNRIYFAGEAIPPDENNNGYAHTAALSGQYASKKILKHIRGKPDIEGKIRRGLRFVKNAVI